MPQMGESVVEGTLERWLVQKGDRVAKDQNLCEITTDKVDAEVPAPTSGVVTELLVAEGETVAVGAALIVIDETAEGGASAGPAKVEPPAGEAAAEPTAVAARATPVAARMARDRDVELERIEGSGVSGRVTKADVEAHSVEAPSAAVAAAPAPRAPAAETGAGSPPAGSVAEFLWNMKVPTYVVREDDRPAGSVAEFLWNMKVPTYVVREDDRVTPFSAIRRRVAEHMVVSKIVSPHVGTVAELDVHRLVTLREAYKSAFKQAHGFNLTYLPFVVQATVRALREFPQLNSAVVGQQVVEHDEIHIGVAVETERGLLVPVVRHADRLSLVGIAESLNDLATRARDREITADDLAGGTFTVSNPGRRGNLYGFAVINQPQVGILRIGEIRKRPVVVERDGEDLIAIHPTLYVSLSYDHRVIDGVAGNGFLYAVGEHLEAGDFEI
jgi:2-oxoglutarate dehydrogenase E2 component (dihydrolipoamide succinyltransferase)